MTSDRVCEAACDCVGTSRSKEKHGTTNDGLSLRTSIVKSSVQKFGSFGSYKCVACLVLSQLPHDKQSKTDESCKHVSLALCFGILFVVLWWYCPPDQPFVKCWSGLALAQMETTSQACNLLIFQKQGNHHHWCRHTQTGAAVRQWNIDVLRSRVQ